MKISIRLLIYVIVAGFIGIGDRFENIFNIIFILFSFYDIFLFCTEECEEVREQSVLNIVFYSMIVPSNYLIIVTVTMWVLLLFRSFDNPIDKNIEKWLLFFCILLNVVFNLTNFYHIFFSLLYWWVFLLCLVFGRQLLSACSRKYVIQLLKEIVILQTIPIIVRAIFFHGFANADMDWVHGTLGTSQGVQLFIICIFIGLIFCQDFVKNGEKNSLFFVVVSFGTAILTGSVALTLLFAGSLLIFTFFLCKGIKKKLGMIIVGALTILLLFSSNQSWVKRDVMALLDKNYLMSRVTKLQVYDYTFHQIPKDDVGFMFFGTGPGRYSSRAAITMTGDYVGIWKKKDMSKYTEQYIYPMFEYSKTYNTGSADMPFSEICALAGEFGLVAFALMIICFVKTYYRSSIMQRYLLILISILLFYDNYLEFPKIAFIMIFCYQYIGRIEKNESSTY